MDFFTSLTCLLFVFCIDTDTVNVKIKTLLFFVLLLCFSEKSVKTGVHIS